MRAVTINCESSLCGLTGTCAADTYAPQIPPFLQEHLHKSLPLLTGTPPQIPPFLQEHLHNRNTSTNPSLLTGTPPQIPPFLQEHLHKSLPSYRNTSTNPSLLTGTPPQIPPFLQEHLHKSLPSYRNMRCFQRDVTTVHMLQVANHLRE